MVLTSKLKPVCFVLLIKDGGMHWFLVGHMRGAGYDPLHLSSQNIKLYCSLNLSSQHLIACCKTYHLLLHQKANCRLFSLLFPTAISSKIIINLLFCWLSPVYTVGTILLGWIYGLKIHDNTHDIWYKFFIFLACSCRKSALKRNYWQTC